MASCFRTVSNRLCCASYLKTPGVHHLETNNTSPSKITPHNSFPKENYNFNVSSTNCISNYINYCNNPSLRSKNTLIPSSTNNVTCQDMITWYRRRNNLQDLSPSNNEIYKNTLQFTEKQNKGIAKDPPNYGRPSEEHLDNVLKVLSQDLPKIFVKPLTYNIYSKDIILENNIRGVTSVGIGKYAGQLALLKALAHIKFAYVKFFILKITKHPEDGTIKCRWQIKGISGLETIFFIWRLRPSKFADRVENAPTWYDGFSIYYVGSDGIIYKHIIDKMMPDDNKIIEEKPAVTKLAMFLGLAPRIKQILFNSTSNDRLKDTI